MTEAERVEAYEQANDAERGAQLIDAHGEIISADSVRAHLSAEHQKAIDDKMASWFGRESELGAYALEDVLELGRHVI